MLPIAYVAVRVWTGTSFMIGDFIGIAQSITYFSRDLEWFFDMILDIKSASLYIGEYEAYIKMEEEQQERAKGIARSFYSSFFSLVCKDVAYVYPGREENNYALHDINLTIRQGEKIAIVGENSAGKTTLAYLLMNMRCSRHLTTYINRFVWKR